MKEPNFINVKYLIIGNSAGGIGAVEAIREVDIAGSIMIVSDEHYPAYSRPLISKVLSGERPVEQILYREMDFYKSNHVDLLTGKRVIRIDPDNHTAYLEENRQVKFDKLLLATGGKPVVPQIEGLDKKGVFYFQTVDDAIAISKYIDNGKNRAVVIGGGLIGVSLCEALVKKGLTVTIIELKDRILNTMLDETASVFVRENLEKNKVNIRLNHTVKSIVGGTIVESVVLDNNEVIFCDMVFVAIGVVPNVELAVKAKIKVNRGIQVNRFMETNHSDIYACGDVAEAYDFIEGHNRVIPIWPNAYIGGRVAGFNMAGKQESYPNCTVMNSLNYFGMDIVTAGVVMPPDKNDFEIVEKRNEDIYKKVVIKDSKVVGLVFVKDIEKAGIIFGLMRDQMDINDFKENLLNDDFGLAYLPEELRLEKLGVNGKLNIEEPVLVQK